MNQYERRFYEDIHKIVIIQEKILKQLEKLNEPLKEDIEKEVNLAPPEYERVLVEEKIDEETIMIKEYFKLKESE